MSKEKICEEGVYIEVLKEQLQVAHVIKSVRKKFSWKAKLYIVLKMLSGKN